MPKGGGSKTPQLDHFPLSTDMVEKQGGKKVRLENLCPCTTPTPIIKDACLRRRRDFFYISLKPDFEALHLINIFKCLTEDMI